jgi:hypothetical protein
VIYSPVYQADCDVCLNKFYKTRRQLLPKRPLHAYPLVSHLPRKPQITDRSLLIFATFATNFTSLAAILVNPIKIANAQQEIATPTNQSGSTTSMNVDQQINDLKSKLPLLSSSQGNEVKDIIQKIQGLDKQQALKTLAAFRILRNLQEYKELAGSTSSSGDRNEKETNKEYIHIFFAIVSVTATFAVTLIVKYRNTFYTSV